MYLSRVKLDTDLRSTKSALANPQQMHAIVAGCFDGAEERQRPIWRIDTLQQATYLLVASAASPDFANLITQLTSNGEIEVIIKDYDGFLSSIKDGDGLRFRLCANPVHSVKQECGQSDRGKLFGHITVGHQKSWLEQRSLKSGFELSTFDVVSRGERRFRRGDQTVTLTVATYEGLLTVSDADLLRQTLTSGIGRAKAYGCGLMTVARL